MFFEVYHQDSQRIFTGTRGKKSPFGHSFGGAADYDGLRQFDGQPPVHLLIRLNLADPAVGLNLPGVQWLPLLCAIRYGACGLCYQVLSDESVKILYQEESKAWDDFPYDDYPEKLLVKPFMLKLMKHDADKPKGAYILAGAFGINVLTADQFTGLARYIAKQHLYSNPEWAGYGWDSPEEYLREEHGWWPFVQGPPPGDCLNPSCSNHGQRRSMRTLAVFEEEEKEVQKLWGPHCDSLQILYQICPKCNAIHVDNQCT